MIYQSIIEKIRNRIYIKVKINDHNIHSVNLRMSSSKNHQLANIFRIIDTNLVKFYSSRPQVESQFGQCSCKTVKAETSEQIQFYSMQKYLISDAGDVLIQGGQSDDDQVVGKLLLIVVEYINKIIELLNREYLCQCKKAALAESLVIKHKIQFMREQNDKFFKLFQQKNSQCERLLLKVKEISQQSEVDLRPITTRYRTNKQNREQISSDLVSYPSSCGFDEVKSSKSSRISGNGQATLTEVKETVQRDHNWYFMINANNKDRKKKIFDQKHLNQWTKSLKQ